MWNEGELPRDWIQLVSNLRAYWHGLAKRVDATHLEILFKQELARCERIADGSRYESLLNSVVRPIVAQKFREQSAGKTNSGHS